MPKADIDKIIKSALNRYPTNNSDSEKVWAGIKQNLDAYQKPVSRISIYSLVATAIICIGFAGSAGYYFGFRNAENTKLTINTNSLSSSNNLVVGHAANPSMTSTQSRPETSESLNTKTENWNVAHTNSENTINVKQNGQKKSTNYVKSASTYQSPTIVSNNSYRENQDKNVVQISNVKPNLNLEAITLKDEIAQGNNQFNEAPTDFTNDLLGSPHPSSMDLENESETKSNFISAGKGLFYNIWANPAYTGTEAKYTFNSQANFVSFQKSYRPGTDYYASFDTRLDKINSGIGVYAVRSISPSLATNTLGVTYAYKIKFNDGAVLSLGGGLNASTSIPYYAAHYEPRKIVANSFLFIPNGEALTSIKTRVNAADLGFWYENNNFLGGVSVKNINQPNYSEGGNLPAHYIYTLGYKMSVGNTLEILPLMELHKINGVFQQQASILFGFKKYFMAGIGYQNVSPATPYGDVSLYMSAQMYGRLRIFAGYGYTSDKADAFYAHRILQTGLRYQFR